MIYANALSALLKLVVQAVVAAWHAISRDTMTDLFRRGEVLPEGRTNEEEEEEEEEARLIARPVKPGRLCYGFTLSPAALARAACRASKVRNPIAPRARARPT